ncbi:MAG: DedA family protein [Verrucomicrobia bacterium]|nr:DedA family protein [Verrucomicrobiota bacterium]MCH8527716.1 DedA family protein [Kiritimatiellia bacterium]
MTEQLFELQARISQTLTASGLWGALFVILLAAQVSEDITSIAAGLLVAAEKLPLGFAVAACFLGILLGDSLLYFAGRGMGGSFLRWLPFRPDPVKLQRARERLQRNAGPVLFGSRFVPVARLPVYLAAGMLRIPPRTFYARVLPAVMIWAPLIVLFTVWMGNDLLQL